MFKHLQSTGAVLVALGLAACSTTPPNPTLEQARARVSAAAQDPVTASQAPLELQRARQFLSRAEESYRDGDDQAKVTHEAYLAAQQAAIARETATARQAQAQIQNADAARAQALLATRTQQAQSAEMRARQLEQELADMQAHQTQRGVVVTLSNVLFKTDSAELLPGAANRLDHLASVLTQHPDYTVQVEGYTDSTGTAAYNQVLSQQRAESVRRALIARGVDPARVQAMGYGQSAPVASNDTPEGRQLNRRVDVVLSGPGLGSQTTGSGAVR